MFSRELKKGSTELLILSLVEAGPRHGYDIGRRIEQRSGGKLRLRVASLYPMLCRLESRGFIRGRWLERPGERRRRYYRITAKGRRMLFREREIWREFMAAVNHVVGRGHA
jgi:transcriptional regulator